MGEWRYLMASLEGVMLTDESDNVCWKLEQSGKISTRSLYRFITFAGVRCEDDGDLECQSTTESLDFSMDGLA